MDGEANSFRVHLQALEDFGQCLKGEADTVQRAADALAARPADLPPGAFAEAFALSDGHSDVAHAMGDVLDKARLALEFAERVTSHVATAYEALNASGAAAMQALGVGLPWPEGAPGTPGDPAAAPVTTGVAAPPPGSLIAPEILAAFNVPVPPAGGTVYYSGGSGTPVRVTVESREA